MSKLTTIYYVHASLFPTNKPDIMLRQWKSPIHSSFDIGTASKIVCTGVRYRSLQYAFGMKTPAPGDGKAPAIVVDGLPHTKSGEGSSRPLSAAVARGRLLTRAGRHHGRRRPELGHHCP